MRQLVNALTGLFWALWNVFWGIALGIVALWGFFLVMGAFSPTDPLWLTIVMGGLAVLAAVHFIHVSEAIRDHSDDELARAVHRMREHRGF